MSERIFNQIEIIGNDDRVKQIREFLNVGLDEDGLERYIDFNNLVRMPEELRNKGYLNQIDPLK